MKLVTPNYSQRTPVFNDSSFTDGASPGIGTPNASFNPGRNSGPLPKGPPKYVTPGGGKSRNLAQGLTNKRYQFN